MSLHLEYFANIMEIDELQSLIYGEVDFFFLIPTIFDDIARITW